MDQFLKYRPIDTKFYNLREKFIGPLRRQKCDYIALSKCLIVF